MKMIDNAAKLTCFSGTTGTLTAFTDAQRGGQRAQVAANWNVGSGLIQGNDGLIRATDNITRGETATIVLRLLQKSGLVDTRSKA